MAQLRIGDILPKNEEAIYREIMDSVSTQIRVAIPGVIQSFDPVEQVVTVQPSIQEKVLNPDLSTSWVNLPLLADVPLVMPRAGNFVLTLPVQKGDECLVIFADMCIDAAWHNGGTNNTQPDKRRHDISDGFCVPFGFSQPRVIQNYSTTSAQLRNLSGTQYVEVTDSGVNLVGNVKVNGTVIG